MIFVVLFHRPTATVVCRSYNLLALITADQREFFGEAVTLRPGLWAQLKSTGGARVVHIYTQQLDTLLAIPVQKTKFRT